MTVPAGPYVSKRIYAAASHDEVLEQAKVFLLKSESNVLHPYWPEGENSGVIWGGRVGRSEASIRNTWSDLDDNDLNRLAKAAGKKGPVHAKPLATELADIKIPEKVALSVFDDTLAGTYKVAEKAFPGMTKLPAGPQVALISLIYNRGPEMGNEKQILDRRWEMRRIAKAVARKDLSWICDELWYMTRV